MSLSPEFVQQQYHDVKAAYLEGVTKSIAWRRQQLLQLNKMIHENREALYTALNKDLGRGKMWTILGEYAPIVGEVTYLADHLEELVKPRKRTPDVLFLATHKAYTVRQAVGTVLIISPWNFPAHLCLRPLAGAIAAGCTAVVKPSELSPQTSQLIFDLVNKYLDTRAFRVVLGAIPESTELLKLKWDKIFYTGGGAVGKIVYKAAAEHLTPVVLELGGKSPVIVDESSDIPKVARMVLDMKCVNAGQICVAPDYVIVHPKVHAHFVSEATKALTEFFGPDPQKSPDFGRIVSGRHLQRLSGLINSQKSKALQSNIVTGGHVDEADRYIAPTIIDNVKFDDPIMEDELFGPILPVIVGTTDEAIKMINSKDAPLALYIMSKNRSNIDHILQNTLSGGVGVNELVFHVVQVDLPFGGIGASGIGAYSGKNSFDAFTHERSVLSASQSLISYALIKIPLIPPFNTTIVNLLEKTVQNAVGVYQPTPPALKVIFKALGLTVRLGLLALSGYLFLRFSKAVGWV